MDKIKNKAIEIAKKLKKEHNHEGVGYGDTQEFEIDGYKYMIEINAFWEKSDWCEFWITGINTPEPFNYQEDYIYF